MSNRLGFCYTRIIALVQQTTHGMSSFHFYC